MEQVKFTCPKCKNTQYDVGEFRATSGFFNENLRYPERQVYHGDMLPVQVHRDLQGEKQHAG